MTVRGRSPVMADVAGRAGVSAMTVSRVLSGYAGIRPETRARVEQAVDDLGYRANTAARTLAGGRSRAIGVVSVETPHFGPSNTLFGIEAAARAHDHRVTFVTLRRVDAGDMRDSLLHLRDSHVDGCIVITPSREAVEALPRRSTVGPLVVMCGDELAGRSTVAVDQQTGARLATRHLLSLGHPVVHHLRGPSGWLDADARESGWRVELKANGIRPPRPRVGDWSARSGYRIGGQLAQDPGVGAVFVANDQMALGLLLAFADAGRPAPEHLSVVGFDDVPESEFFAPPLTTVRQDFAELGRLAVERLAAMIGGQTGEHHVAVPPELIVRRSTRV